MRQTSGADHPADIKWVADLDSTMLHCSQEPEKMPSTPSKASKVFTGNIIYTTSPTDLVTLSPGCIIVDEAGIIRFCGPLDKEKDWAKLKNDYGFTDSQVL